MIKYEQIFAKLRSEPRRWLVTGAGGFIGSNLVESLLLAEQNVTGFDNYSTGYRHNLEQVRRNVGPDRWSRFAEITGDIRNPETCSQACEGIDYVLHQAALGSVPRSIENPIESHASNVTGFLNMLNAGRLAGVKRFVYASSSSVYGDEPELPKVERRIGECLSPYTVTKLTNELYANVFGRCYGTQSIGLRYFNVFGPRQDPDGAYAAVIPKWIASMIKAEPIFINGDGETSRDFCYIANVVQANILAATAENPAAVNQAYNVAVSARTTLNQLFALLRDSLAPYYPHMKDCRPQYRPFREGDVRHSEADITKAGQLLGYEPTHTLERGMSEALEWYRQNV